MGELFMAIAADGIATIILFIHFQESREIRRPLLPLCILTSVHTILIPLFLIVDANRSGGKNTFADIMGWGYLFSPLVLLLFGIIYTITLSEHSRMPRPLGISCFVFNANIILQGILVLAVLVLTYGG